MVVARPPSSDTDVGRILASLPPTGPAGERPALAVLVGLPGTGKTRLARKLRAHTGAVVLESDVLRRLLYHRPSYSKGESRRLFAAVHQAIERLLAEGTSVILDATNVVEAERAPLYDIAHRHGARLVLVQLTAPEALVKQRLARRRPGLADHSEAGSAVYEDMRWREETIARPHHIVDTSKPIDRAVMAIAKEMMHP